MIQSAVMLPSCIWQDSFLPGDAQNGNSAVTVVVAVDVLEGAILATVRNI